MNKTFWSENIPRIDINPPADELLTVTFYIWDATKYAPPIEEDVRTCRKIQFSWQSLKQEIFKFNGQERNVEYLYDGNSTMMTYNPATTGDWVVKRIDIRYLVADGVERWISVNDALNDRTVLSMDNDFTITWIDRENSMELRLNNCFDLPMATSQRAYCLTLNADYPSLPIWFYMHIPNYWIEQDFYTQSPYYGGHVGYIAKADTILNQGDKIFYCSDSSASLTWNEKNSGQVMQTFVNVGDQISSDTKQKIASISYSTQEDSVAIPYFSRDI